MRILSPSQTLFHNDGVFIERYYPAARHVEVQVQFAVILMLEGKDVDTV